jgi:signal transduction histidine kinase
MTRSTAAWLAWSLCAACVALIALALLLDFLTADIPGQTEHSLGPSLDVLSGLLSQTRESLGPGLAVLTGVLALAYPTVGALIVSRLPTNPIGWIFCGAGLLYAARRFTMAYADYALFENISLPGGEYMAWFSTWAGFSGLILAEVFLMLLFPNGRLPSRWWRIVAWAAVCGAALTALADALTPGSLDTHPNVTNPFGVVGVIVGFTAYYLFAVSVVLGSTLLATSTLAALFLLIARLHRARGDERQQLKWFLNAAVPAAVGLSLILLQSMVANLTTELLLFNNVAVLTWVAQCSCEPQGIVTGILSVAVFALLVLPVFTYIAILRYHLYDIDRIINRTLVYGALSAIVVAAYMLVVVALGSLFQAKGNLAVSLLATGVVAVLFQPLRSRLQRSVNRLMYGERDDPYAVTSRLGRRIEATLAPEAVLPTIAETIAQALKLPYAAILLKEGEGFRSAAAYGSPGAEPEALPLVYQREEVGRLVIAPRAPGEAFSSADRRLLEDLARQAEVAVHAVRLTADLQSSRERLVTTREEERRRLRRDLHDGIGSTLTGLALQLNAVRKLVVRNMREDAAQTLARLEQRTEETIAETRRLIYGLRPPALDDLGLIPSIRQQAQSQGMVDPTVGAKSDGYRESRTLFSMEAPEELPPLPAAVEVACYRIVQEALTNVARHAHAKTCHIRLSVDRRTGMMEVEITDDGVGTPKGRVAGVGLSSMRERAEELGGTLAVESGPNGGTRVLARLPLPAPKEHPQGEPSSWRAPSAS